MRAELFLVFFCAGFISCQVTNELDFGDINKSLSEKGLDSLPAFNKSKIDPEKIEKVFREKCEKQGADDATDILKEQQESLKTCVIEKINMTTLQEELDEAKKTGSMDEVFTKYCKKWPDVYSCWENATVTLRRCLEDKEAKAFNKTLDILQELQEFMCFKDGDRLAMFVAEGGPACIEERKVGIQDCLNETVGSRLPASTDDLSLTSLPTFLFSQEDCNDFDKIRECVNKQLDMCKDSTPANIVDAFFKFLKKQMPCDLSKTLELAVGAVHHGENLTSSAGIIGQNYLFLLVPLSFLVVGW